MHASEASALGS